MCFWNCTLQGICGQRAEVEAPAVQPCYQATMGVMMSKELPPGDYCKQYARQMQTALVEVGFWKTCVNCEHFSNNSAERREAPVSKRCHRWNAEPPPEVIIYGCEEWLSVVPF